MKQKLAMLLLALLTSFTWCAIAEEDPRDNYEYMQTYDFEKDGIYYYITYGKENEVTVVNDRYFYIHLEGWKAIETPHYMLPGPDYDVYSGDVVIPEKVEYQGKEYTVTSIMYEAMFNCVNLKSVKIPDTVTDIWPGAFYGCKQLEEITMPPIDFLQPSVTAHCQNLKFADFSKVKTGFTVDYKTFVSTGCTSLMRIILPYNGTMYGFDTLPSGCELIMQNPVPPTLDFYFIEDESVYTRCPLYVPEESVEAYRAHPMFGKFETIIGMSAGVDAAITTPDIAVEGNTVTTQQDARIYSLTGAVVASPAAGESTILQPGMYIVKCGEQTRKIAVN